VARIVPDMLRLQSWRSVYSLVAKHVRDPRRRVALSFRPLLIGGNPFTASSIYSLIAYLERRWGVHFPMGGLGRLVSGLVGLIEGQGGMLRYNAEVRAITIERGAATGVRLASGEEVSADIAAAPLTSQGLCP